MVEVKDAVVWLQDNQSRVTTGLVTALADYRNLRAHYDHLKQVHDDLGGEYRKLTTKYDVLKIEHLKLHASHADLTARLGKQDPVSTGVTVTVAREGSIATSYPTQELRWKNDRSSFTLQQKWLVTQDGKQTEDWRDVPHVNALIP